MRLASVVLVAACGSSSQAPVAANRAPDPPPAAKGAEVWVDQHLTLAEPNATRGRWTLTVDGDHATIVSTWEQADGTMSLERADRDAVWKPMESSRTMTGPVRRLGDHVAYDLEGPNESLQLRCWKRSIVVAPAGAHRVHRPGHEKDCQDPGTWNVPTVHVDAMLCGFGEGGLDDGQENGIDGQKGPLDETLFRFVEAPGIEFVQIDEPCFTSNGLRLVKR